MAETTRDNDIDMEIGNSSNINPTNSNSNPCGSERLRNYNKNNFRLHKGQKVETIDIYDFDEKEGIDLSVANVTCENMRYTWYLSSLNTAIISKIKFLEESSDDVLDEYVFNQYHILLLPYFRNIYHHNSNGNSGAYFEYNDIIDIIATFLVVNPSKMANSLDDNSTNYDHDNQAICEWFYPLCNEIENLVRIKESYILSRINNQICTIYRFWKIFVCILNIGIICGFVLFTFLWITTMISSMSRLFLYNLKQWYLISMIITIVDILDYVLYWFVKWTQKQKSVVDYETQYPRFCMIYTECIENDYSFYQTLILLSKSKYMIDREYDYDHSNGIHRSILIITKVSMLLTTVLLYMSIEVSSFVDIVERFVVYNTDNNHNYNYSDYKYNSTNSTSIDKYGVFIDETMQFSSISYLFLSFIIIATFVSLCFFNCFNDNSYIDYSTYNCNNSYINYDSERHGNCVCNNYQGLKRIRDKLNTKQAADNVPHLLFWCICWHLTTVGSILRLGFVKYPDHNQCCNVCLAFVTLLGIVLHCFCCHYILLWPEQLDICQM